MIFCVSYVRIHVLMSLITVTIKFWTVTVTVRSPTTSLHRQLQPSAIDLVVTVKQVQKKEEGSEPESSDDKTRCVV
jgi:hypothetical protein